MIGETNMNDKENKRIQEITSQYGQGSVDSIINKIKQKKKGKHVKPFKEGSKDQGNVDKLVAQLKENVENER